MPSQFFGLNIGTSGLMAASASLNVTSNNIANINTPGYSRQNASQSAKDALRVYASYGCAGSGVNVDSIDRMHDRFYDTKYRENESQLGTSESKAYYNNLIEDYLNDNGESGFNSIFSKFKLSVDDIISQADTPSKTAFVSNGKEMCEYFENVYSNLQKLQSDVNKEIKICTDKINSIAKEVASLNKQINTVKLGSANPNELLDKRDKLIDELSELVSVKIKENAVGENGMTRYEVTIANGISLVDGYEYNQLLCDPRKDDIKTSINDVDGLYDIKVIGPNYNKDNVNEYMSFPTNSSTVGGKLYGLFAMRDGNNEEIFEGNVLTTDGNKITVLSDTTYMNCQLAKEGTITIDSKIYAYKSWDYDDNGDYVFTLESNVPTTSKKVSVGTKNNYQGIPYYLAQMNEWIRQFSQEVNDVFKNGYSSNSKEGTSFFTSQGSEIITKKDYASLCGNNFKINKALVDDASKLATKKGKTEGVSEFENLVNLKETLYNNKFFRGSNAGSFLEKMLADVSLNTSNSSTLESLYTSLKKNIDNQRLSISGVDNDEEAINLVKYQNAYMLSSKVIQVFTEVYDRLILQTGV